MPGRYQQLCEVFLFGTAPPLDGVRFEIESAREHAGQLILKFRGVDTISQAEEIENAEVRVPFAQRADLPEGEFFQSDLIGCEVRDRTSGQPIGLVTGWQDAGGAGLLEIGDNLLIPFAKAICVDIDTRAKRILVDLPEGLKDVNRP
jgi:16S rRNA processing protein RimM